MRPIRVDIIAYAPTAFFHCGHCEVAFHHLGIGRRLRHLEADESLPADLQLEYLDISAWVHDLYDRHGDRVTVRVIDAASLAGVWASLRLRYPLAKGTRPDWGRRTYPMVVLRGGPTHEDRIERDYRALDPVIDRMVAELAERSGRVDM